MQALLFIGTIFVGFGLYALAVGTVRSLRPVRLDGGAMDAILDESPDLHGAELSRPLSERVLGPSIAGLQRAARSITPSWWVERLRHNTSLAGLGRLGAEGALALKVVAVGAGALLFGTLSAIADIGAGGLALGAALGGVIGFVVPDALIAHRASARQDEIRRTLPEALDLLAIAVQAGMGLEQAIELVARRLPGALGEELHRMLQEVQLGASRREALTHLRERTDVSELSTFALALAQADALGSPIGELLRIQAVQMRMLRRQRARERAAKVPVKLLFPLLLFIFPALGIVVIGPAAISILKAFS